MNSGRFCFLNGKIIESENAALKLNDLAITRGYGVFDYLRTQNKKPFHLPDHLNRLRNSAKGLHLKVSYSDKQLEQWINELISLNKFENTGLRIEVTGGYANDGVNALAPNIFITADEINFPNDEQLNHGVSVMTYHFQRETPEIKSINYQKALELLPVRKARNVFEVLYYSNNVVTELTRSNVFVFKNGILKTPKQNVLQGITRKVVLQLASKHFETMECNISIDELFKAEEIFLTGTTKIILPITKVDSTIIGKGTAGLQTIKLLKIFKEYEDCY